MAREANLRLEEQAAKLAQLESLILAQATLNQQLQAILSNQQNQMVAMAVEVQRLAGPIAFDGGTIEAIPGPAPRDYQVILKPTCKAMRISYVGQEQRIKRSDWATVGMTPTVGADGKPRDMLTISRKTFLHWLMTIATNTKAPPLQEWRGHSCFEAETARLGMPSTEWLSLNRA